jgi:hypothetical protein
LAAIRLMVTESKKMEIIQSTVTLMEQVRAIGASFRPFHSNT